jgi:hypothetical protein
MFKHFFILGIALVLSVGSLHGQDRPHYREFVLGSSLSLIAEQVKTPISEATVVHARPALLQDLKWRQPYFVAGSSQPQKDAVEQIAFSFYNDQLFSLAIEYDRQRTEGMTDADMIAALSDTYGPPSTLKPRVAAAPASRAVESAAPLSRWESAEYSVTLLRSTFGDGFRVVVTSTALDALARSAEAQAVRLDQQEAPQRAIAQQKQDADAVRASQEQARAANKAAFRP